MHMEIMQEKKKRRKRRRRVFRLLVLCAMILFLTQTDIGQDILYRLSDIDYEVVGDFLKGILSFFGSILPNIKGWLADALAYLANFL